MHSPGGESSALRFQTRSIPEHRGFVTRLTSGTSIPRIVGLFALLTMVPLSLLTYLSLSLAQDGPATGQGEAAILCRDERGPGSTGW
jgi:hypothetical protein